MPIKPRPHLAWIVRFVPLVSALIVAAFFLLYPPTSAGFREGVRKWWAGEEEPAFVPMTSLPSRPCPIGPSLCSPVRSLERLPEVRAVVERHVPGFWADPALPGLRQDDLGYALQRRGVGVAVQNAIEAELGPVREALMQPGVSPTGELTRPKAMDALIDRPDDRSNVFGR